VDGTVVRERPLRIQLAPDRVVRLSAFGRGGERVDRVLDETAPDELILTLPRTEPNASRDPNTNPTKVPTKSPFLGNPYGPH